MKLEVIKKRKEKDLQVTISVTTNKQYVSLVGRDLQLVMRTPLSREVTLPFEIIEGFKVRFNFRGKLCGIHSFTIYENRNKKGATAVDSTRVIEIVPKSYMENDSQPDGLDVESVDLGVADFEVGTVGSGGSCNIPIVQTTGNSKISVMSQDAVTRAIDAVRDDFGAFSEESLGGGNAATVYEDDAVLGGANAVYN